MGAGRNAKNGNSKLVENFAPNREELAWAAGFWDGEGCTAAQVHKNGHNIHMSIAQVYLPNLHKFHKAVGGLGYIYGPHNNSTKARPNCQPQYSWQTSKFEHVQAVIAMLWPFLTDEKKDQYKRVLALAKAKPYFHLTFNQMQKLKVERSWISRRANAQKET